MNARTRVVAVSIVVLALVVGTVSTYLILPRIAPGATSNSTSVTTLSSHSITAPTSASSSNSQRITTVINGTTVTIEGTMTYVCSVQVPPPQWTYLRVITDGVGTPVSGLQVTMQSEEVASCDRNNVKLTNSVEVTNSSGWTLFQQGYPWYFVFTYSGYIYNFTAPGSPMSWTVATISVPSGKLSTEICGLGGGNLNSSCEAASTTTIVRTNSALRNTTYTSYQWTNLSSSGLELLISLNATRIASHRAVAAKITLFNSLNENLTPIPHPANYGFSNCDFRGPWGILSYALFKGHYTSANISSSGEPLRLVPPVAWSCVTWPGPSKFVFLPRSSSAVPLSGGWAPGQAVVNVTTDSATRNFCCTVGTGLFGYWDLTCCVDFSEATTSSPHFHYFSPGQYTLFVNDMWNQTVYAYFQVSS